MKKRNVLIAGPILLFALSCLLLLMSAVGSTRAALTYYSENYEVSLNVPSIGVSLVENDSVVSSRNYEGNAWKESGGGKLLENMLEKDERLTLGKTYKEELCVENSGTIDSYVRVILYKNWSKDGEPADTQLSPDLIGLNLAGGNWVEDVNASTKERTILYYTKVLPKGQRTPLFCTGLRIDPSIGTKMTETWEWTLDGNGQMAGARVSTEFAYEGYQFNVKAEVDAVQTHSAERAIKSAWGVDVIVAEDGSLSLAKGGKAPAEEKEAGESDMNEQP